MKIHRGANTKRTNVERAVARRLAGTRAPNTGQATAAGLNDRPAVEVKPRQALPAWLLNAITQARRNAPAERLPVVVLHLAATRTYLAFMPLEILEHLLQEAQPPTLV